MNQYVGGGSTAVIGGGAKAADRGCGCILGHASRFDRCVCPKGDRKEGVGCRELAAHRHLCLLRVDDGRGASLYDIQVHMSPTARNLNLAAILVM